MKEPLFMQVGPGQHLVPADPHTAELVDTRLKPGTTYKVTVVNDRTAGSLKLYWAGLNLLHENLPEIDEFRWPTSRSLHNMLMMALGYTSREYFLDARSDDGVGWREVVDSIAIDNMDEATFKEYAERAAAVVVARWGWDPFEVWKENHPAPQAPPAKRPRRAAARPAEGQEGQGADR